MQTYETVAVTGKRNGFRARFFDLLVQNSWGCLSLFVLIALGDEGWTFYVILDGTLDVSIDGRKIVELRDGSSFGELALLSEAGDRRTATVTTKTQCLLGTLSKTEYTTLLKKEQVTSK